MLEPQIQAIEAEVEKLLGQLANQGLISTASTWFVGFQTAVADLRNAIADLHQVPAAIVLKPGETKSTLTTPPDAKFFEKSVPLKPAPSNE